MVFQMLFGIRLVRSFLEKMVFVAVEVFVLDFVEVLEGNYMDLEAHLELESDLGQHIVDTAVEAIV
jgi:hypothetical protein